MKYRYLLLVLLFTLLAGMLISCEYFALPSENVKESTAAESVYNTTGLQGSSTSTSDKGNTTVVTTPRVSTSDVKLTTAVTTAQNTAHSHSFTEMNTSDEYLISPASCTSALSP